MLSDHNLFNPALTAHHSAVIIVHPWIIQKNYLVAIDSLKNEPAPAKTVADFEKLNDDELKALFAIDPSAAPVNPWNPKFDNTPKGKSIRMQFEAKHPVLAAGLKSRAPGFNLSARAEMYNRGLIPLDREVHEELMHCDPLYRQQKEANQKAEEERILAEWSKKADQLAAARGYDPNSQIGIGNHGKFGRYFRELQEHQRLESQG